MIIVKILGGLGNQMFQYATARALAERAHVPLKLDLSGFATYEHHAYALNHLSITAPEASASEIAHFKKYADFFERLPRPLQNIFRSLKIEQALNRLSHYVREKSFRFDSAVLSAGPNAYLDGYFQSEQYFSDIRPLLKKEFGLAEKMDPRSEAYATEIRSTETPICLHVRRGDFAFNPAVSKFHGVAPLEYYYEAAKILASRVQNPRFFVFSDSIEWVKENLKLPYPHSFIGQGAGKNYEDITLMSLCRHFILSNSSFGWWGAWLSATPLEEKIVIAPKKWVTGDLDTTDLIPQTWMRI
jgi:hypothetical protein